MSSKDKTWDQFIGSMDKWVASYQFVAELAKKGSLVANLGLKDIEEAGKDYYSKSYFEDQEKKEYFDTVLNGLRRDYDPDRVISGLDNTLLCLKIKKESHLHSKFSGSICGKYKGMARESHVTKLLNSQGEYEEMTAAITLNIAYPTEADLLKVAYLDLDSIETFG